MNLLNSLQPAEAAEGRIDNYTSICCDVIIDDDYSVTVPSSFF